MVFSLPTLKTERERFLILVFVLTLLLRIPSLFEPYWYGDEGVYLTLGEAIKKGLMLYRDIHDNKPPLLYIFASFSGGLLGFRLLLMFWSLATVFLFFRLSETLFPKQNKLTALATVIFAVFSSIPLIEGNIANAENFMLLPTLLGALLVWENPTNKRLFLAGISFSLAALFKIPAAFDFAAIIVFLLFFQSFKNLKEWLTNLFPFSKKLLLFALGFILPIFLTFIYFGLNDALYRYFIAAFSQNIPYLSSWQTSNHSQFAPTGIMSRFVIFMITIFLVWLYRKRISSNWLFVCLWFSFSLFAATLSGRPYPHYLLQVLPSLSLLVAWLTTSGGRQRLLSLVFLGIFAVAIYSFRFWSYSPPTYYQNFFAWTLGQKNKEEYFRTFNGQTPQTYKLAEFLVERTTDKEKIFIWGDNPNLYALSRRLPVGRYVAAYHINDFNGYQETMTALTNNPPRIIISYKDEEKSFPELASFLESRYSLTTNIDDARIYQLNPLSFKRR
ncbi:MAG: hypothetical protein Q7S03_02260 [bacterium]|nr:hypothetical protein [bacterium]